MIRALRRMLAAYLDPEMARAAESGRRIQLAAQELEIQVEQVKDAIETLLQEHDAVQRALDQAAMEIDRLRGTRRPN